MGEGDPAKLGRVRVKKEIIQSLLRPIQKTNNGENEPI
jgi:hypothetical protein